MQDIQTPLCSPDCPETCVTPDPGKNAAQFIDKYLKKHLDLVMHGVVLEAGCGSGIILHALGREYANLFFIGVDSSEDRVGQARSEVAGLNHVWATSADIYDLPFPDNHFELVYSRFLYECLEEPVRTTNCSGSVSRAGDWCSRTWMAENCFPSTNPPVSHSWKPNRNAGTR